MKKILAFLAVAAIALVGPAVADTGLHQVPMGYQQITTVSSSVGLTVPAGATQAVITIEAQAVRYRDDGTAPTSSVGMPLAVGASITYTGTLSAIRFIEQTSGAKIDVLYYR